MADTCLIALEAWVAIAVDHSFVAVVGTACTVDIVAVVMAAIRGVKVVADTNYPGFPQDQGNKEVVVATYDTNLHSNFSIQFYLRLSHLGEWKKHL
jgi:hypothetical protein